MALRKEALSAIISKHHESTFNIKNCITKLSPEQAFISIEFKWRGANPILMMSPMERYQYQLSGQLPVRMGGMPVDQ